MFNRKVDLNVEMKKLESRKANVLEKVKEGKW